jgi:two-component system LytT family response regulator
VLNAVIIEDELKYLAVFKDMLEKACPDVRVIGTGGDMRSASELISSKKPDIVFLDIELTDGNTFDLLIDLEKKMGKDEFNKLCIIFTTAYNQFAIKAFRFSAIDYLLKPILKEELMEAVEKAKSRKAVLKTNANSLLLENVSNQNEKKICLSTLSESRICRVDEIVRCESEHNYTTFFFINEKPLMISKTLKEYEDLLKEYGFERVHQSHLINNRFIKSYIKKENGFIQLKDDTMIPVSRRKKEVVIELMKSLRK